MPENPGRIERPENLPAPKQNLELLCCQCREKGVYEVGLILCAPKTEGKPVSYDYSFTHYFRCRKCGSAGPWEVADEKALTDRIKRAGWMTQPEGLVQGISQIFDGTVVQTPAMGEDHLRKLIEKDPNDASLCIRLANLLQRCEQKSKASEWFERAIRLDPTSVEARYHLFSDAVDDIDIPSAITHAVPLVRHFLEGRKAETAEATQGLAFSFVETLRDSPEPFRDYFLAESMKRSTTPELIFIRTMLEQGGDEKKIVEEATERLLRTERAPTSTPVNPHPG